MIDLTRHRLVIVRSPDRTICSESSDDRETVAQRRFLVAALAILLLATTCVLADDEVYLKSPSNPRARTKVSGQILDYTGKELVLRTDMGAERRFPGDQVADVETTYSPEQLAGDKLLAKFDFSAALAQ